MLAVPPEHMNALFARCLLNTLLKQSIQVIGDRDTRSAQPKNSSVPPSRGRLGTLSFLAVWLSLDICRRCTRLITVPFRIHPITDGRSSRLTTLSICCPGTLS